MTSPDPGEQTILITGASQGIGRYLAVYFGHRCKKVILLARNKRGLIETARQVTEAGGDPEVHATDLSDEATLIDTADTIVQSGRTIDTLIHNAADVTSKPFLDTSVTETDRLIRTNVIGPLQLTRLLMPCLERSQAPSIVFMSSLAGLKANPAQTVYSISKAAVNGTADALRAELGPKGFHVMNVPLSSVGTQTDTRPGQVPVALFAQRLERALERRQDELYMSSASKWLMRAYKMFPSLARMR